MASKIGNWTFFDQSCSHSCLLYKRSFLVPVFIYPDGAFVVSRNIVYVYKIYIVVHLILQIGLWQCFSEFFCTSKIPKFLKLSRNTLFDITLISISHSLVILELCYPRGYKNHIDDFNLMWCNLCISLFSLLSLYMFFIRIITKWILKSQNLKNTLGKSLQPHSVLRVLNFNFWIYNYIQYLLFNTLKTTKEEEKSTKQRY